MAKTTPFRFAGLCAALLICFVSSPAQDVPPGYILQYSQNFRNTEMLHDFMFDAPLRWEHYLLSGNPCLRFVPAADDTTGSVLPPHTALLKNKILGDFILEARIMPLFRESGCGDVYLLVSYKNMDNLYSIVLSENSESGIGGAYLSKKGVRRKPPQPDAGNAGWKAGQWNQVRVERNITRRTIRVFVNDMKNPVVSLKDFELVLGYTGFGASACSFLIDDLNLWAPTVISE